MDMVLAIAVLFVRRGGCHGMSVSVSERDGVCVCLCLCSSPPYFFTPSILGSDEPPLLEEPPAFFVAHLHRPKGRHSTQGKSAPALKATPHPSSIVSSLNSSGNLQCTQPHATDTPQLARHELKSREGRRNRGL